MEFRFNEKKAAQAAAYLLRKHGGRRTYGVLIKLLYLADRKKLVERGSPITGDRLVSMPHGTALSDTLETLRNGPFGRRGYILETYISRRGAPQVEAIRDDTDELSAYELRVLDEVDREFGRMTFNQLRDYTHKLPEWHDPNGSSVTISPEAILEAAGLSWEEIAIAEENARTVAAIDDLPN